MEVGRHRTKMANEHIRLCNVRDHVSQPYSTTGNIIVLYILIFKFLERSREDRGILTGYNMNFPP